MKLRHACFAAATILFFVAEIFPIDAQPSNILATTPVYVPDVSHAREPLPSGVFVWDAVQKAVDATNEQDFARFIFSFTNVSSSSVTILTVHPSCGCTTAELPPVPWQIPAGGSGEIKLSVNLEAKAGTLFKTVNVETDRGNINLMLQITIAPPPPMPELTPAQRDAGMAAAKTDRQAVFKGDCASCHAKKIDGKYGQQLYDAVCAICHEAEHRATMVPDLHNLPVPTNEEFWRAWITAGKAGTLMPAFATSQGGPLNDLQIANLAAYLNGIYPSRAPQSAK